MKYLIISDNDELGCAIDIKANFETPLMLYQHYICLLSSYYPELFDESFIDFVHKRFEIICGVDIDLFVLVRSGTIEVRERK